MSLSNTRLSSSHSTASFKLCSAVVLCGAVDDLIFAIFNWKWEIETEKNCHVNFFFFHYAQSDFRSNQFFWFLNISHIFSFWSYISDLQPRGRKACFFLMIKFNTMFEAIYLSIVNAVIVKTVALVKLSAANLWYLQTVSLKG